MQKNGKTQKKNPLVQTYKLALSIVKKLNAAGHIAYFAGGWVRDFLLQHPSEDIDIATSAYPEDIQKIFSHTIPVGIAFGILLVVEDGKSFEVATFRREAEYKDGRRPSSVSFTTAMEDAKRRDFTINGMFFDPIKEEVLDYIEGQKDLKTGIIRAIGDAEERINEDRLRMIRAIRFAARFQFKIEEQTQKAILKYANELFPSVAKERIWQEISKMANYKGFSHAMEMLHHYNLLSEIFPLLHEKSEKNIHRKLKYIDDFPKKTPAILKILELFPSISLKEKIELGEHLKLSNKEIDFIYFQNEAEKLFSQKHTEDILWAYFFSDSRSSIVIDIFSIKQDMQSKKDFLQKISLKQQELSVAIERIKTKKPLVTASFLIKEGVVPGKAMGELLRLAEKININEKVENPFEIIKRLKSSLFWPNSQK